MIYMHYNKYMCVYLHVWAIHLVRMMVFYIHFVSSYHMRGNFLSTKLTKHGCITLRIFTVVGQIKFIFQFKMFWLESCICDFHVYVSWMPREGGYFTALAKLPIEKIPML